jgi:transaldolase
LAYAAYQQVFETEPRYTALRAAGARAQRPLWASTGVKNTAYPDTMYVAELVAPNTVSTIPEPTLEAVADHGVIVSDTVTGKATQAQKVFDRLTAVGIDLPNVFAALEDDGVSKFAASWSRAHRR